MGGSEMKPAGYFGDDRWGDIGMVIYFEGFPLNSNSRSCVSIKISILIQLKDFSYAPVEAACCSHRTRPNWLNEDKEQPRRFLNGLRLEQYIYLINVYCEA